MKGGLCAGNFDTTIFHLDYTYSRVQELTPGTVYNTSINIQRGEWFVKLHSTLSTMNSNGKIIQFFQKFYFKIYLNKSYLNNVLLEL